MRRPSLPRSPRWLKRSAASTSQRPLARWLSAFSSELTISTRRMLPLGVMPSAGEPWRGKAAAWGSRSAMGSGASALARAAGVRALSTVIEGSSRRSSRSMAESKEVTGGFRAVLASTPPPMTTAAMDRPSREFIFMG